MNRSDPPPSSSKKPRKPRTKKVPMTQQNQDKNDSTTSATSIEDTEMKQEYSNEQIQILNQDGTPEQQSNSTKKKINLACVRCRRRHIKCDGQVPTCGKCLAASETCEYIEGDKKVVISMRYLNKLQNEISKLKIDNANLRNAVKQDTNDINKNSGSSSQNSLQGLAIDDINDPQQHNSAPTHQTSQENTTTQMPSQRNIGSESNERDNSYLSPNSKMGVPIQNPNSLGKFNAESVTSTGEVIPPFLDKYGRIIHSRTGEKIYIGSSSMTLFGLEINKLVQPSLYSNSLNSASNSPHSLDSNPSPGSAQSPHASMNPLSNLNNDETVLEREGNAYRIMLGKAYSRPGINVNFTLPSYSYAMLLVDTFISYNDGCFYFFNEGIVKENLRRIYNDEDGTFKPDYGVDTLNNSKENESLLETIWFCKVLLIFAVGEMYLGTANNLNGYKITSHKSNNNSNNEINNSSSNINNKNNENNNNNNNNRSPSLASDKNSSSSRHNSHSNDSIPMGNSNSTSSSSSKSKKNKKNKSHFATPKLPGSGFFNQASDLFAGLFASGAIDNCAREGGIEVLLLYAFYLQVADCTVASYFYFGIALRASLVLGMHVDIGKDNLNRYELEHRRRLWWTVYMYERMLASKAGLPLSLTDDDISTELPEDFDMSNPPVGCEHYIFPEAEFIRNCVKITQINADILRGLYTRKPSSNILPVVHELVVKLLRWKRSLPDYINCDYSQPEIQVSRLVVNMMTEYFQGLNLAVRPLLFHFVLLQLKSSNPREKKFLDLSKYSSTILTLLNASFQASMNSIRSLWALMPENMVALFGYMDREYLYTSTATLILFNAAFGVYDATKEHIDHALTIFTKMRNLGNHPATLRREQLLKLLAVLDFTGSMSSLLKKHYDTLYAPVPYFGGSNKDDVKGGVKVKSRISQLSPSSTPATTGSGSTAYDNNDANDSNANTNQSYKYASSLGSHIAPTSNTRGTSYSLVTNAKTLTEQRRKEIELSRKRKNLRPHVIPNANNDDDDDVDDDDEDEEEDGNVGELDRNRKSSRNRGASGNGRGEDEDEDDYPPLNPLKRKYQEVTLDYQQDVASSYAREFAHALHNPQNQYDVPQADRPLPLPVAIGGRNSNSAEGKSNNLPPPKDNDTNIPIIQDNLKSQNQVNSLPATQKIPQQPHQQVAQHQQYSNNDANQMSFFYDNNNNNNNNANNGFSHNDGTAQWKSTHSNSTPSGMTGLTPSSNHNSDITNIHEHISKLDSFPTPSFLNSPNAPNTFYNSTNNSNNNNSNSHNINNINNNNTNATNFFSPSLVPQLPSLEDIPEDFETLSSVVENDDLQLWQNITNQASWLGSNNDEVNDLSSHSRQQQHNNSNKNFNNLSGSHKINIHQNNNNGNNNQNNNNNNNNDLNHHYNIHK
ncbi:hypothetical protein B5S31_g4554 [[Candida] boidinii]|nr:hypothetical protein B5S31_g4554 [[Candida] boidinii]